MRDRRPVALRPGRHLTAVVAALAAIVAITCGCTAIPSGGRPQSAPARPAFGAGGDGCCGLIVRGPQPDWSPDQIVYGFLLASAKPAHNFALAREYLAPGKTRNSWRPGSAVTILAQTPEVLKQSGRLSQPGGRATVTLTGQQVATLKGEQYTPVASGTVQGFTLTSVNGQTLISSLPTKGLLLTADLFHQVYTARELYYYGLRNNSLVPSPVFVPTDSDIANTLVGYLRSNPAGELGNLMVTGFPPGAQVGPVQAAPGKTAVVNVSVPRGTAPATDLLMASQLVATLTSSGYGSPLFDAVKLKVNGNVWSPPRGGGPVLTSASPGLSLPQPRGNGPVYYLGADGSVRVLDRLAARGIPVTGEAGTGQLALHDVGVSLDRKYLAGIAGPADTVYTGDLVPATSSGEHSSAGQLRARLAGADFSSLSWDSEGYLWIAGQVHGSAGIWMLKNGRGQPIQVSTPRGFGPVTGLRVAPDGNQIAMITKGGHMELGYIMRTGLKAYRITHLVPLGPGLFDVSAMTWFDEDHLVAAARLSSSDSQPGTRVSELWDVPADGDNPTLLHGQQGGPVTSIAAAGKENPLYLIAGGRLQKSVGLGEPWTDVTAGQAAVYPG